MPRPKPDTPRRGRPPAAAREQHIGAILDAATAVFLEQGFADASTAEIARRAGASKTTLYARFPTKAALFLGLMTRRMDQIRATAAQITLQAEARPPAETLFRYGMLVLRSRLDAESVALIRLFLAERHRFPAIGEIAWIEGPGAGEQLVAAYLRSMADAGVLHAPDPDAAARRFLGALIGWEMLRLCFGLDSRLSDPAVAEEHVRAAVRITLAECALGPPASSSPAPTTTAPKSE